MYYKNKNTFVKERIDSKMTKAKKISLLISIILVIIGAILFAVIGFNYDLSYGQSKRIVVPMKDDFVLEDYNAIAKEIYGNAKVETISVFREGVSIKVADTTDEQLDSLVSKINEKYGYEYTRDDLKVTELSKVKVVDIIKPAIIPIITTLLIALVYMLIRYRKMGILHITLNLLVPVVIIQLLVFAIYLICRIPVTNILLPVSLTAYAISLIYSAKQCENEAK